MKRTYLVAAALIPLLLVSVAFASVFVYYPVSITAAAVSPPVIFQPGSNAGQDDLGPNTIEVTISPQNTSLQITVHPTYQVTLYKNVSLIVNVDTKAYNVFIRVVNAMSLPSGSSAELRIYTLDGSTLVASVNLLSTGTVSIGSLGAGQSWSMWVFFNIPEQSSPPPSTTAELQLIYTPSAETPP